jgi:hypothetical protein
VPSRARQAPRPLALPGSAWLPRSAGDPFRLYGLQALDGGLIDARERDLGAGLGALDRCGFGTRGPAAPHRPPPPARPRSASGIRVRARKPACAGRRARQSGRAALCRRSTARRRTRGSGDHAGCHGTRPWPAGPLEVVPVSGSDAMRRGWRITSGPTRPTPAIGWSENASPSSWGRSASSTKRSRSMKR